MRKTVQPHGLRQTLLHHRRWLTVVALVTVIAAALVVWAVSGRKTELRVVEEFKTSDYPVAVTGTQEDGYVVTAAGQVFALRGWHNQSDGVSLQDNATSLTLSTSGKYLLVAGQRLTLLDNTLQQKWSRKTTTDSVVETALFTTSGHIAAVYSFLKDQSRQFVLYDLAGKYLDGYSVPDFGRGSQISLARSGTLVVTLSGGTIYTIDPQGKVIAKFSVPNVDSNLGGLVSAVSEDGKRILAGYSFTVSGAATTLPRYLFDQAGKQVAEVSTSSVNGGLRSVGNDFLLYGGSAELLDSDGKQILSASKLNFSAIDASVSGEYCAILFQEETTSQSAVYFLGVYDMKARGLVRQWSTAESEAPRVFQLPGARSILALSSGFLVLVP
ncbi:MAG: hypothetical protein ACYDHF_08635 [Candidatus Cryosericum sp.]